MTAWLHVLVPAYGPSPFLLEALRSVPRPPDGTVAVTVVDDASPGPEVRRAAEITGSAYVRLERNHGVAGAFQRCVDLAAGRYTVVMGSDDVMEPHYVASVRRLTEEFDEPAMATTGVTVVDAEGRRARPLADRVKGWIAPRGPGDRLLAGDRLAASLLLGNWLYFPAVAWRTDVLRGYGFRPDMRTALDLDLELRVVFDGGRLARSGLPAFRYRRHASSVSSLSATTGDRFEEEHALASWAVARAVEHGWRRSVVAGRLRPTSRAHALLLAATRRPARRDA